MNDCTFIIFGATGDLTKRKLIPALYKLIQDKKLKKFLIIGAAIDDTNAEQILERARHFIQQVDEQIWTRLKQAMYYKKVDFNNPRDFDELHVFVNELTSQHAIANRIAYLAVSSVYFCPITQEIGRTGLIARSSQLQKNSWQRIVYEKPFGIDLSSAQEINNCIQQWFNENQIFRIDHYLTKELVANITLVRFTNIIFEPLWNNNYIDHVQIILDESIGLEGRGRYYDNYGVLKDVIQNHGLQLLSLIAMELPKTLQSDAIRDQKAKILQNIRFSAGFLGQYAGYHEEPDVAKGSQIPTFACLRFLVETDRWKTVPFYIKAGKKLDKKNTSIHIKFKDVACDVSPYCVYESNYLTIQIDPDSNFSVQLNAKKPGATLDVTPVQLSFSHNYVYQTLTAEAYEVLIEQIIMGDQSLSVRFDEIEYAWKIIEHIERLKLPQYKYQPHSFGPKELEEFAKQYNMKWRV